MIDREKHIKNLSYIMDSMPDDACSDWRDSLAFAVDTLRKYQQIEQILDDWKSDGGAFEMSESYWLNQIREVVEDGNGVPEVRI